MRRVDSKTVFHEPGNRNQSAWSSLDRLSSGIERAMAFQYVKSLVGRVAVSGRSTDARSADLLNQAEVPVGEKATG